MVSASVLKPLPTCVSLSSGCWMVILMAKTAAQCVWAIQSSHHPLLALMSLISLVSFL